MNYKLYLEEVNRIPLTPPNVDSATNIGIIHDMTPYRRSANTCKHGHTKHCECSMTLNHILSQTSSHKPTAHVIQSSIWPN